MAQLVFIFVIFVGLYLALSVPILACLFLLEKINLRLRKSPLPRFALIPALSLTLTPTLCVNGHGAVILPSYWVFIALIRGYNRGLSWRHFHSGVHLPFLAFSFLLFLAFVAFCLAKCRRS